jgi:hypothetical protein
LVDAQSHKETPQMNEDLKECIKESIFQENEELRTKKNKVLNEEKLKLFAKYWEKNDINQVCLDIENTDFENINSEDEYTPRGHEQLKEGVDESCLDSEYINKREDVTSEDETEEKENINQNQERKKGVNETDIKDFLQKYTKKISENIKDEYTKFDSYKMKNLVPSNKKFINYWQIYKSDFENSNNKYNTPESIIDEPNKINSNWEVSRRKWLGNKNDLGLEPSNQEEKIENFNLIVNMHLSKNIGAYGKSIPLIEVIECFNVIWNNDEIDVE